ncbi:hypothetical protein GCM10027068_25450 [Prescottella soli]
MAATKPRSTSAVSASGRDATDGASAAAISGVASAGTVIAKPQSEVTFVDRFPSIITRSSIIRRDLDFTRPE